MAEATLLRRGDFLVVDCSTGALADLERCARVLRATDLEVHVLYRCADDLRPLRVVAQGPLLALPADTGVLPLLMKLRGLHGRKSVDASLSKLPALSPRETAVLRVAAGGRTDAQVAAALGMQIGTVKTYLRRIRDKWDLPTTAAAIYTYRLLAASHGSAGALSMSSESKTG